jgi:CRP-like cAMP-binding protein
MVSLDPKNALLQSLLPGDFDRLRPHLELVDLRIGCVLYEMEDRVDWVFFPQTGLLSLITVMATGDAIETSIVGREGGVTFIEALGSGKMFTRVIVQIPGKAFRVQGRHYREAFGSSISMRSAVHRQTELLQAQSRQAIACHVLHTVEKRFNRWLLECQDLSGGMTVLPLKHDFLAVMLGVSRSTVTKIAIAAQLKGLIRYVRGSLTIVDREGLEKGSCECRASVQYLRSQLEPESHLGRAFASPGSAT